MTEDQLGNPVFDNRRKKILPLINSNLLGAGFVFDSLISTFVFRYLAKPTRQGIQIAPAILFISTTATPHPLACFANMCRCKKK